MENKCSSYPDKSLKGAQKIMYFSKGIE